ncbi:MAG: hypothetical protein AB7O52_09475 [Planctomycetota bacterium]
MSHDERTVRRARRRAIGIVLLAPLLIGVGHLLALRIPSARGLRDHLRERDQLQTQVLPPAALDAQRREIAELTRRIGLASTSRGAATAAPSTRPRSSVERARLRQVLNDLFERHAIVLTAERQEEVEVGTELASAAANGGVTLPVNTRVPSWILEFRARYSGVLELLEALSREDVGLLPLRLEMQVQSQDEEGVTWTLHLV